MQVLVGPVRPSPGGSSALFQCRLCLGSVWLSAAAQAWRRELELPVWCCHCARGLVSSAESAALSAEAEGEALASLQECPPPALRSRRTKRKPVRGPRPWAEPLQRP